MQKSLIDTNLIIRFLTSDDSEKAINVEELLKGAGKKVLLDVVVAEIVWVLKSYYKLDKADIVDKIRALIHVKTISCSRKLLDASINAWEKNNISYIDAYLVAHAQQRDLTIYSYDERFDKVDGVNRKEP